MDFSKEIVKGERIQQLADVYLGLPNDFVFNPLIAMDVSKHFNLQNISMSYDNPKIIFCYSHRINILCNKLTFFQNPFVLITHNSDENIVECNPIVNIIANYPLLQKWYAQNLAYKHPKIHVLPIGMANDQWSHGDVSFFRNNTQILDIHKHKTNKVYFHFNVHTNYTKRMDCFTKLQGKIPEQPAFAPFEYLSHLSTYEFCICPEGNGFDTHRLWEALYVKCIPIVLRNTHIELLISQLEIPMVVLDDCNDFDINALHYEDYSFDNDYYRKITMPYFTSFVNELTNTR